MKCLVFILLFGVICVSDSVKTDTTNNSLTKIELEQSQRMAVNCEKQKMVNQGINEMNGKLDSIIAELAKDTIRNRKR